MGYSSSGGPKGLGVVSSTPSTAADFNQVIALIAQMGNFRGSLTEAERDAISGAALYAGLLVFNSTVGTLEKYSGSGWDVIWIPARLSPWGSNAPADRLPLFKSGRASGTTSGTGVLTYTFPTAFPAGVSAVMLMPTQNGGDTTVLVEASVTATGFQTLWPGMPSTAVAINYYAVGY